MIPLIVIVACTKLAYFCDREASLNFQTAPELLEIKLWLQSNRGLSIYLPLITLVAIE